MNNKDMYFISSEDLDSKKEVYTINDSDSNIYETPETIDENTVFEDEIKEGNTEFKDKTTEMSQQNTINNTNKVRKNETQQDDKYILYKKLPFIKRKMTFMRWLEKNSFAAMFTFLLFIFGFVTLVSIRIKMNSTQFVDGVLVEIPPVEVEKPKLEEVPEKKVEALEIEKMLKVSNTVADANATDDTQSDRSQQLLDEAQALQEKLDANKASYEQGLNEIKNMSKGKDGRKSDKDAGANSNNNRKKENSKDKRIPTVSKRGNVTVEYNLPGRYATYLPIPAYKCEEGGKVIVSITVNRNGDVIEASVQSSTTSKSSCIAEMAVQAAKGSRFDVNGTADEKQMGTITYLFMAQ